MREAGVIRHSRSSPRGQANRPRCKRRQQSHTPVPSHTNSLMRLPARLQNP